MHFREKGFPKFSLMSDYQEKQKGFRNHSLFHWRQGKRLQPSSLNCLSCPQQLCLPMHAHQLLWPGEEETGKSIQQKNNPVKQILSWITSQFCIELNDWDVPAQQGWEVCRRNHPGKKKKIKNLDSSIFQALALEKIYLSFDRGLHQTLSGDLP